MIWPQALKSCNDGGASATFARALRQFGRRALVDLVAVMGNYAGTAALLTAFDMQVDPGQPPLLPPP
jgi:4-carboxymuconolactone decarboxylase